MKTQSGIETATEHGKWKGNTQKGEEGRRGGRGNQSNKMSAKFIKLKKFYELNWYNFHIIFEKETKWNDDDDADDGGFQARHSRKGNAGKSESVERGRNEWRLGQPVEQQTPRVVTWHKGRCTGQGQGPEGQWQKGNKRHTHRSSVCVCLCVCEKCKCLRVRPSGRGRRSRRRR